LKYTYSCDNHLSHALKSWNFTAQKIWYSKNDQNWYFDSNSTATSSQYKHEYAYVNRLYKSATRGYEITLCKWYIYILLSKRERK